MSIEKIEAFQYGGRVFTSEQQAVDFAEGLVSDLIKPAMLDKGFTIAEWVKVSTIILEKRAALRDLLDY